MPVPTLITDLSSTAASNSPPGAEAISTNLDNYLRAGEAFIRQLFDTAILWGGTASGTNTITLTASPAPTAYKAGQGLAWISAGTNTGAATVNANGLGAKNLYYNNAALAGAELPASGGLAIAIYDGTQFQLARTIPTGLLVAGNNLSDLGSAATALNNILPSQTGNSGKYLTTNGTAGSWGSTVKGALAFRCTAGANIAAGTTTYLSCSGNETNEANAEIRIPFACTASNLYVQSGGSPGTGKNFTFTLRVNEVDSALTAAINGGSTLAADTGHTVGLSAGDRIAVKLATDSGSNSSGGLSACIQLT